MSDATKSRQEEIFPYGMDSQSDSNPDHSHGVANEGVGERKDDDELSLSDISESLLANRSESEDVAATLPPDDGAPLNVATTDFADSSSTDVVGVALGMIDDSDVTRIRSHITANAGLYAELATMESVAAVYAQLAPRHDINRGRSAGIRSRLIARAASSSESFGVRKSSGVRAATRSAPQAAAGSAAKNPRAQSGSRSSGNRPAPAKQTTPRPASDAPRVLVKAQTDEHHVVTSPPVIEQRATPPAVVTPRPSGAIRAGVWITLALLLAAIVAGVQEWRMRVQQETLQTSVGAHDATLTAQVTELKEKVFEKDSAIKALTSQRMRVVPLLNYGSKEPLAKLFWNQATGEWTVYTYDMAAPRPGKTYQIWLVTNTSAPTSLGTFEPKQDGAAALEVTYVLSPYALMQVIVSEEPIGGSSVRTGGAVVAGR